MNAVRDGCARMREVPLVSTRDVPIREDSIRLGQFLKLADLSTTAPTPSR